MKYGLEVFLAENIGKLIVYIMFKVEGDSGYINDIVISKKEERKGEGGVHVTYAEAIAKSRECYLMKTNTTENANDVPWRSYNFWLREGYEDIEERMPTDYNFKGIPFIKKLE